MVAVTTTITVRPSVVPVMAQAENDTKKPKRCEMGIKRFDSDRSTWEGMVEDKSGDYVLYTDHLAALSARDEEIAKEVRELIKAEAYGLSSTAFARKLDEALAHGDATTEHTNVWKDALIEACVTREAWFGEDAPRAILNKLICYENEIALDPRVSEAARKLAGQTCATCKGEKSIALPWGSDCLLDDWD